MYKSVPFSHSLILSNVSLTLSPNLHCKSRFSIGTTLVEVVNPQCRGLKVWGEIKKGARDQVKGS